MKYLLRAMPEAKSWSCASILAFLVLGLCLAFQVPCHSQPTNAPVQTWQSLSNRWASASAAEIRQAAEAGDSGAQFYLGWGLDSGRNGLPQDATEAVRWYHKAADNGNPYGQFALGYKCSEGNGVPQDFSAAAKYYRLAAEQGHSMAQNNLGHLYFRGTGVEKNFDEALKWYRKAAEQREAYGQANLGWMYERGYGVPKDRERGRALYLKAAEQGLPAAQYLLGLMAEYDGVDGNTVIGNYAVAAEWFGKAAKADHALAMLHLGDLYYYGKIDRNLDEAEKWFRRAANHGNVEAAMRLGELFLKNYAGHPQDHAEAVKWFRFAASKGNLEAQYELACLLLEGKGITHDAKEAEKWLRSATESGNSRARVKLSQMQSSNRDTLTASVSQADLEIASYHPSGETRILLGIAYEEGQGGSVNIPMAAETYWRVLNQGPRQDESKALERLVNLYAQGKLQFQAQSLFSPKDPTDLARRLSRRLDLITSPESLYQLGALYYSGKVVPKDWSKAVEHWTRAAQGGSLSAIHKIGELWEAGVNGTPDLREAARWYRRAAFRGLACAQLALGRILENDPGASPNHVEAWAWLALAADGGSREAKQTLTGLETRMTQAQLQAAEEEARKLKATVASIAVKP